jgi:anti-sigma B factor antagonist
VLNIEIEDQDNGVTIWRLVGELDAFTVQQFREFAHDSISQNVLLDMSNVAFADSAGLGALIGAIRRTREYGGDIVLVCSRPTMLCLLRTTGFERIVTLTETTDEANLATMERLHGADHPDTLIARSRIADSLIARNSIAGAYRATGRTTEAIALYQTTLAMMERLLGIDHPYTVRSSVDLDLAYQDADRTKALREGNKASATGVARMLGRVLGRRS